MIMNLKFEILLIPIGISSSPVRDRDCIANAATGSMGIVSVSTEMKGVCTC